MIWVFLSRFLLRFGFLLRKKGNIFGIMDDTFSVMRMGKQLEISIHFFMT